MFLIRLFYLTMFAFGVSALHLVITDKTMDGILDFLFKLILAGICCSAIYGSIMGFFFY